MLPASPYPHQFPNSRIVNVQTVGSERHGDLGRKLRKRGVHANKREMRRLQNVVRTGKKRGRKVLDVPCHTQDVACGGCTCSLATAKRFNIQKRSDSRRCRKNTWSSRHKIQGSMLEAWRDTYPEKALCYYVGLNWYAALTTYLRQLYFCVALSHSIN